MTELLPCPFCGSSDVDAAGWLDGQGRRGPECMGCGATAQSVDAWNRRHTPAGWQLVPVEPTAGMMRALWQAEPLDRHAAMLSAAPRPGGAE